MKNMTKLILIMASAALTGGCVSTQPALTGPSGSFGAAIGHNIDVQAIAPSAAQKSNTHIPANPKRRAAARENYENGTTPEPQTTETKK